MLHFILSIFSRISFYINVRTVLSYFEPGPFCLWACLLEIRPPMNNWAWPGPTRQIIGQPI